MDKERILSQITTIYGLVKVVNVKRMLAKTFYTITNIYEN